MLAVDGCDDVVGKGIVYDGGGEGEGAMNVDAIIEVIVMLWRFCSLLMVALLLQLSSEWIYRIGQHMQREDLHSVLQVNQSLVEVIVGVGSCNGGSGGDGSDYNGVNYSYSQSIYDLSNE
ncbi:Hypothetical predicted protein [Octopus vulgaris]|uniref:Uncharacterized protein n=1 Tax=Octopus vulgaris TaxID=6645 RepID=A0AA36ANV6_OCTVU|nr:Hypothetical predicted protein [Octopus vulgaris]